MQLAVAQHVVTAARYSIAWSGQFEYLERAVAKIADRDSGDARRHFRAALPDVHSAADALLLMSTVPFALVGGFWLIWILGHAVSVATLSGSSRSPGVAAEFGVR